MVNLAVPLLVWKDDEEVSEAREVVRNEQEEEDRGEERNQLIGEVDSLLIRSESLVARGRSRFHRHCKGGGERGLVSERDGEKGEGQIYLIEKQST